MIISKREIKRVIKSGFFPAFWLILSVYFGYHAINGEHGIRRYFELKKDIQIAKQQAKEIALRREELERKVKLLNAESLDKDMVEESAQNILSMGVDGDYIIIEKD
ncbi:MAG: septum formation initiator family protein [Alphaproteobacteria bacterium]|nr:septum formation initiator family protein [Alphaproteobacteria bacterium]